VLAARQQAAGERKAWTDLQPYLLGTLRSLSNTTTVDAGPVTIKNIFGYRQVYFHNLSDIDGSELSMINADNLVDIKQTTDEFQVSGAAFNDSLTYIAGLFYSDAKPDGPNRLPIQLFAVTGTPLDSTLPAPFNGAFGSGDYYHDKSKAVFGQVSYKLSALSGSLDGVSIDVGVRHTKDETSVCDVPFQAFANPAVTEDVCKTTAAGTTSSAEFSKTTYTFGINYAITDELFVYGVTRTGYRAGGLNTPVFGGSLVAFQSYQPETVQDVELGLKTNWSVADVAGRFNLAIFQSKFKDVQAGIPTAGSDPDGDGNDADNPSNTTFTANVGKATVKGVEADVLIAPFSGLELTAAGTYLDKKIDSVNIVLPPTLPASAVSKAGLASFAFIGSPDSSYNLGVNYTLPLADLGDLRFSAKYFRISKVQYGSVHADSYDKADFRVDWQDLLHSGLDVGAFVTNAFDQAGAIAPASSSEGIGANSALYNEPRIWGVQLRYQFGEH
jgi:iron complex outermembrane receptor protein